MVDVKLHDIGEGMHEAEILQFLVQTGDIVKNDAPLVEIQTDKMTAELTAPAAGTVTSIEVAVGDTVEVGDTILKIGEAEGEKESPPQDNSNPSEEAPEPVTTGAPSREEEMFTTSTTSPMRRVLAAPYTRKIARDHDIDIEKVQGTGPAGRVLDEDVYAYINESKNTESLAKFQTEKDSGTKQIQDSPEEKTPQMHTKEQRPFLHVSSALHSTSVDIQTLKEMCQQLDISLVAFLTKGVQIALKEYPQLNARINEEDKMVDYLTEYHLDVRRDSHVCTILDVNHQSLQHIEQQLSSVTRTEHYTFSISLTDSNSDLSNHMEGLAAALLVYPEEERPAVYKGAIEVRRFMDMSLFFDTRAVQAFEAATFLNRIKQLLENPNLLLVELV